MRFEYYINSHCKEIIKSFYYIGRITFTCPHQVSPTLHFCYIVGYIVDGRKSTSERDLPVCGFMANLVERFLLGASSNGSLSSSVSCSSLKYFCRKKFSQFWSTLQVFNQRILILMKLIILLYG